MLKEGQEITRESIDPLMEIKVKREAEW